MELRVLDLAARHRPVRANLAAEIAGRRSDLLDAASLLVVGSASGRGEPIEIVVRTVRESYPHIGIFLVAEQAERVLRRLPVYARAGIDDVFELDIESDVALFCEWVRRRLAAPSPAPELRALARRVGSSPVSSVALWCVRNGYRYAGCERAETYFGYDRKTLYRWAKAELGATLGQLLTAGRRLHADALRRQGVSYHRIARALGYRSGAGVAMLLRSSTLSRWISAEPAVRAVESDPDASDVSPSPVPEIEERERERESERARARPLRPRPP